MNGRFDGEQVKALLSSIPGNARLLALGDRPLPLPGPGEVRIKVSHAGINYPDALIIEDRYQIRPARPFTPGIEVAGHIDAVGEGAALLEPGQPCVALLRYGGLAEYAIASMDMVASMPAGMDGAAAASMIVTYGTAWHALKDRAALQERETLLVLGVSGGVGIAAVELGIACGARVIAAVSSEEKARIARDHGADDVLVYPREGMEIRALAALFKEGCAPGADCIYDPVGSVYGEAAISALAWQGRYLVIGFAGGIPSLAANLILLKSANVFGVSWGETVVRTPGLFRRHMAELGELAARGVIAPHPDAILPLDRAASAIAALAERRAIGKTVISMADA
jgi:NADPH2:quinone reductase